MSGSKNQSVNNDLSLFMLLSQETKEQGDAVPGMLEVRAAFSEISYEFELVVFQ